MVRRSHLGALLVGGWVCTVAIYWWGIVVPGMDPKVSSLATHDLAGYFFPRYVYGSRVLAEGTLPLWNPWEFAGLPYLGTAQAALFYPPRLLLFGVFEPTRALHLFMVVHGVGLWVAAYVLFVVLGLPPLAAAFGALCVFVSPPFLAGTYAPHWASNFMWVPAILAALVRLLERPGPGAALAMALCLACLVLAGYPEYVLDVAIVGAIVWMSAGIAAWRAAQLSRWWRATGWIAAASGVGVLLSAVQWVPLLSVVAESWRQEQRYGTVAAASLLTGDWSAWWGWWQVTRLFMNVPPVGVACIVVGVLAARRPGHVAMAVVAVLALGALSVLQGSFPFSMFRSRIWLAMLYVPLGFFAGCGLAQVLALEGATVRRRVWMGSLWLACVAVLLVAASAADRIWLAATAFLIGAAAVVGSRRGGQGIALAGFALAVAGVLASVNRGGARTPVYPTVQPALARAAEIRGACGVGDGGRVLAPAETYDGAPLLGGFQAAQGYPESLMPRRSREVARAAGLELFWTTWLDWQRLQSHSGVLRLLDVRCVVTAGSRRPLLEQDGFVPGPSIGENVSFRRAGRAAWIVTAVEGVADEKAALERVLAPDFPTYERVVLEGVPSRSGEPVGRVLEQASAPEWKRFATESPSDGYLVVSEAWAPGWTASVDGRPATVERGDFLLQVIAVPAGRHTVELRYWPPGFALAIAASLFGTLLCAGLVTSAWRFGRHA